MPVFTVAPVTEPRCAATFGCDLDANPKPLVAAQAICLPANGRRTGWKELKQRWSIVEGWKVAEKGVDAFMFQLAELDFSSPNSVALRRCNFTWGQPGLQFEFNGNWTFRFPINDTGGVAPQPLFYWHCAKSAPGIRQPILKASHSERVEVELFDGNDSLHEDPLLAHSGWERQCNFLSSGEDKFTFGYRERDGVHRLEFVRPFKQRYCELVTKGNWVMSLHGKG